MRDIREHGINPYDNFQILDNLNSIIKSLEKIFIKDLKTYRGPIEKIDIKTSASETDHLLVGVAFGYFLENQDKAIAIISSDYDIEQIALQNSIHCCFDVIAPLSMAFREVNKPKYRPDYANNSFL